MNPVFKNLERGIQGNMKQLDRIGSSLNEEKVAGEEAATKAKAPNKMLLLLLIIMIIIITLLLLLLLLIL